ncbi:hypothetical protein AVEN_243673-1 [Araneus ventricosus]|uniref:Uncharacterized protein n=1 Tax=Araneus ventricosus TaxID=182803 RepID=A0A4Y2A7C8_ARAVE|nr:hypothetical protein AVEN_243673-1 [Araneus ventricosus]
MTSVQPIDAESDTFLENKENATTSSVKYHKCLLKFKSAARATTGSYFSYMFRDYDTSSAISDYMACAEIVLIVSRETPS